MGARDFQQLLVARANDAPKPTVVAEPCAYCRQFGSEHDPVVVQPGDDIPAHYGCAAQHAYDSIPEGETR